MKIEIEGKEFNFVMNGTIGPAFLVEKMTGHRFNPWGTRDEDGNVTKEPDQEDALYLLYVILQLSNPDKKDSFSLDWFIGNLTTPLFNEMTRYAVDRWLELENFKNPKPEDKEEGTAEKKS